MAFALNILHLRAGVNFITGSLSPKIRWSTSLRFLRARHEACIIRAMPTRLSLFCTRIIESCWLVAVLLVPIYFNPYSLRIFDPDKVILLRSIVLIMGLAWLVKTLERRSKGEGERENLLWLFHSSTLPLPYLLAVAALGAISLVATITSVAPGLSFWGSYPRLQGTYTTLAYLVIFALMIGELRSRAQFDRVLDTIILASWPVALLGILQRLDLSPIDWRGDDTSRVFSSMGNPIFLGAYLVMMIPLTAARLGQRLSAWRVKREPGSGLAALCLLGAITAQVASLFFTASRGPWLAFFIGTLFITPLLWFARQQWRFAVGGLFTLGLVAGAVLLCLNVPGTPLASLSQVPGLKRLVGVLDRDPTVRTRVLIWEGAANLLSSDPARALIGFGPETTQMVLLPHVPPELFHYEEFRRPDRAHNAALDALMTTGVLGWLAWLGVFVCVIWTGMGGLYLIEGRVRWLVAALLGGAAFGSLGAFLLTRHWIYMPLGLSLGLIGGLVVFLLAVGLRRKHLLLVNSATELDHPMVLVGLMGGVVTHFLEINLGGIAVPATQLNFWVFAALIALLWKQAGRGVEEQESNKLSSAPLLPSSLAPLLGTLLLTTVVFDTIVIGRFDPALHGLRAVLLIGLTWFWLTAFSASSESSGDASLRTSILTAAGRYVAISFAGLCIFLAYALALISVGADALPLLGGYWAIVLLYLLLLSAALPMTQSPIPNPQSSRGHLVTDHWSLVIEAVLAVIALVVINQTNLTPARADVYAQAASVYASAGLWDESLSLYTRVLSFAPEELAYLRQVTETLSHRAQATANPDQRANWFAQARLVAQRALTLQPNDPDNAYNLAHLHLLWARATTDRAQQVALLDQALSYYRQAAALAPRNPEVLNEWALTFQLKGEAENALALYRRSLAVDPELVQTYVQLGWLYQQAGRLDEALQVLEQARSLDPGSVETFTALGDVYLRQGRIEEALQVTRQAVALAPQNPVVRYNLARLYQRLGQFEAALAEAQNGLNYATPDQQMAFRQLIQELQTRRP